MVRLPRRLAAAVALALSLSALLRLGELRADSASRGLTVKVAQFNVRFDFDTDGPNRWAPRVELVAGLLREAQVGVACLQEDKDGQVEDLKRALPGWEFVGKARDGQHSEHCSVAFDTATWHAVRTGDFWLSDTPEVVGSNTWHCKFPHKVTWAELEAVRDPLHRRVTFLSTHLDEHREKGEVREKSAEVIRTWLVQHARETNVVVCGDFNAGASEPPHELLVKDAPGLRLRDAWDVVKPSDPQSGTIHGFTGKSTRRRIDWILVSGFVKPLSIRVDRWNKGGRYPSDHFPVVAEMEVGPAPIAAAGGTQVGPAPQAERQVR
ncbi:MAG: endonuclease/exonuclease/phosphatase family protein [Planctomycetes bacterium]|nr:endonuclease/exonuclease/phosphatase family protein [Planctomycetota bacterium]